MIQKFSSSVKNVFLAFSDILFPPLCKICKERSSTVLFCPICWELCAFFDPIDRCPHCFIESDGLCRQCIRKPRLAFVQAAVFEKTDPAFHLSKMEGDTVAAFCIYAWVRLDWPTPDLVIPMPGAKEIAFYFAEMIERPVSSIDPDAIEEGQILLLLNVSSSLDELERSLIKLSISSPKRGYILHLFMPKPNMKESYALSNSK